LPLALNPYRTGNPVGDHDTFVGRQDVLRDVLQVLRQPGQNALTLFGQRRIGKTSVLQYLARHLVEAGPYRPVYFDLQDKAALPLARVLRDLARTIADALAQPEPDLGAKPLETFRDVWLPALLDAALPDGCSLVLLFDEFDVLADPGSNQAAAEFFPYLRGLLALDPARVQFVFVLGRNVGDLANIAHSLFKSIPYRRVSLLSEQDTARLARISQAQGTLHWPDEAVRRVWSLTNGHPFLTQALCSQVWEDAYDALAEDGPEDAADAIPRVTQEMVEAAVPGALESTRNSMEWLWTGLGPAERVVSAALAQAGPRVVNEDELAYILREGGVRIVIRELQSAPQLLQDWDILEPADGGYRFRVELLRRWIVDYRPLKRVQEELDHIQPVAESLYQAALGMYQSGAMPEAEEFLRRAVGLNPSHIRATLLLVEILIANANLTEARTLLENLLEYNPGAVRPRLIQVYLQQAAAAPQDQTRLDLYEAVLNLDAQHPEAMRGKRAVWQARAEAARKKGDLRAAREAFAQAGMPAEAEKIERELRERDIATQLRKIEALENKHDFDAAHRFAQQVAEQYLEAPHWPPLLARLEAKKRLAGLYRQALGALEQKQFAEAQKYLAEVVHLQPDYEDAARYLQLAVVGDDVERARKEQAYWQSRVAALQPAPPPRAETTSEKTLAEVLASKPEAKPTTPKKTSPTASAPEPETKPAALKKLSPWNPLDYFRLLWWALITPKQLLTYRKAYGKSAEHPVGNRLAFSLAWLPLLLPPLGLGLDLASRSIYTLDAATYLWMSVGIGVLWVLYMVLANWIEDFTENEVGCAFFGMAVGVAVGVAFGVAVGVAVGVAFGVAFGAAGIVAGFMVGIVAFGVAGIVAGIVAVGVAVGVTVGVVAGVAGVVALGVAGVVALGVTGGVVGVVAFGVAVSVSKNIDAGKPTRWALVLLVLAYLVLGFYSFGGAQVVASLMSPG